MSKILLIEDDENLRVVLHYNFTREGHEVLTASDGEVGLELARSGQPDLIILDVMLPYLDGFSLCRMLRKESTVPILMLTARNDEIDRIAGLEMGADDYIVKPFSLGELLARVRAALRRSQMQIDVRHDVLSHGDLEVDTGSRRVFQAGREIVLAQKEFDLLVFLMRNRGIALSRDVLLERVWGFDFVGESRTVDVHVRWLREKIERDPSQPQYIETVRGIGYRFDIPGEAA